MKYETIKEMFELNVLLHPDNVAFYEKTGKDYVPYTYKELYEDVNALGNSLIEKGLKDQNIAIIGKNSYEWAVAYLTTICGLGTVIPLDKELTKEELETSLKRLPIGAIIYSKEQETKINKEQYKTICMQKEMKELIKEETNNNYEQIKINPNKTAVLLFTSGTTSESKIVMLSNKNIMHNINNFDQFVTITENDRFYSILPMHHTFEGSCGFLAPLSKGASIIHLNSLKNVSKDMLLMKPTFIIGVPRIIDLFDKKITKEIKDKGKTTLVRNASIITNLVPSFKKKIFKDIHDAFGGNLKTILVGGAACDPLVLKRLRNYGFNVLQGYGLTECAPLVAGNAEHDHKDEAAGKPMRETKVKIINKGLDGVGEIAVKGPQVFKGYYENEEATNEVFDEEGYFLTGDLGKIDRNGFIIIKGRSKNVIIAANGKNVYPEELETIISKNENIRQAIVKIKKNAHGNDVITVEIVLVDELIKKMNEHPNIKEEITKIIKDYIDEINKKISDYKRIKQVELKEEPFKETSTNKVKRYIK
ncbi:MAG: AMP-binding protein [Bacilli bacterium]